MEKESSSSNSCYCDPLHKFLRTFFYNMFVPLNLQSHNGNFRCSKKEETMCTENYNNSMNSESDSRLQALLDIFIEKCVSSYKGLVVRPQSNLEVVHITVTQDVLKKAEFLWSTTIRDTILKIHSHTTDFSSSDPMKIDLSQFDSSLPVKSILLDERRNCKIALKDDSAFKMIIEWILMKFPRSCLSPTSCSSKLTKLDVGLTELNEDERNIKLSQYRKFLTALFVKKAMEKSGCVVNAFKFHRLPATEKFKNELYFAFTNTAHMEEDKHFSNEFSLLRLKIGNVILNDGMTQTRQSNSTSQYLFNLRYEQVNHISESRASDEQKSSPSWSTAVSNLTVATINFDLLSKDPKADVTIVHKDDTTASHDCGALLIMYNYARTVSILKTFARFVEDKTFPPLPSIDEIDFSKNTSAELSLLHLLLQWPRTVDNVADVLRGEINTHLTLVLMKDISLRFNNFYTKEIVLVKASARHNFSKMMKRIYLVKAIRSIYEEFFDLLSIDYDQGPL